MTKFIKIDHEWVGTQRIFVPQGCSPYDLTNPENGSSGATLAENFDVVTVKSAWLRPAFQYPKPVPDDTGASVTVNVTVHVPDTVFFYIRSHKWGHNGGTHVTAADLPLSDDFDFDFDQNQKASAS